MDDTIFAVGYSILYVIFILFVSSKRFWRRVLE